MLKFLQEFLEAVFPCSMYGTLLLKRRSCRSSRKEVLMRQTGITAEKGHNFWFDRWITLKFLQEFPVAIFLVVAMESLLVKEKVLSHETGIST